MGKPSLLPQGTDTPGMPARLANLAGIPGVSVPCGSKDGLPIGLQLLGRVLDEATVLRVADVFQRRTDYHTQRPQEFL